MAANEGTPLLRATQSSPRHQYSQESSAVRGIQPFLLPRRRRRLVVATVGLVALGAALFTQYPANLTTAWLSLHPPKVHHHTKILLALLELNFAMTGSVIFPKDKTFDTACHAWNEAVNNEPPMAIVEATNTADVSLALPVLVQLQNKYKIHFAIKSGGHNYGGWSTSPGGVILSLARINPMVVDYPDPWFPSDVAIATIGPGTTDEDILVQGLMEHNYAGVLGSSPDVAMGGWLLGGGIGYLSRKYGLGIDNVVELQVVLADGRAVVANQGENPNLFWALRGAGQSNFGVVTEMRYKLYPAQDQQLFVTGVVPPEHAAKFFADLGAMEDRIPGEFMLEVGGNDASGFACSMSWFDRTEQGLIDGQTYIAELLTSLLHPNVAASFEYMRSSWLESSKEERESLEGNLVQGWFSLLPRKDSTKESWTKITETLWKACQASPYTFLDIELLGGAIGNIDPGATAYPWRDSLYSVGFLVLVPASAKHAERLFQQEIKKLNKVWKKIEPLLDGVFPNYVSTYLDDEKDYAKLTWSQNLDRLSAIKAEYE